MSVCHKYSILSYAVTYRVISSGTKRSTLRHVRGDCRFCGGVIVDSLMMALSGAFSCTHSHLHVISAAIFARNSRFHFEAKYLAHQSTVKQRLWFFLLGRTRKYQKWLASYIMFDWPLTEHIFEHFIALEEKKRIYRGSAVNRQQP